MEKVTFNFKNKESRDLLIEWFFEIGEDSLCQTDKFDDYKFDYNKAFETWGFDPAIDGDPVITIA